jgi:hypothetical protein
MAPKIQAKLKALFTTPTLIKIVVIVLIVVFTLFPALFDPVNADWRKVFANFVLTMVIFLASFIAQNTASRTKHVEDAKYKDSEKRHIDEIREIQNKKLSKFHQIYVKYYNKNSKDNYIHDIFNKYEIPMEYYKQDFKIIKRAFKDKKLTAEQVYVIKKINRDEFEYDCYEYKFLTSTQILKKNVNTNKSLQANITWSNLLSKISMMMAFSIIAGMLVWDKQAAEDGIKNGQVWIDLVTRIITLGGGVWTGEFNGAQVCSDDIRLYDKFYDFNKMFVDDVEKYGWKPKPEDLEDNVKEYLESIKNENLSSPTIVEQNKNEEDSLQPKVETESKPTEQELSEEEKEKLIAEHVKGLKELGVEVE